MGHFIFLVGAGVARGVSGALVFVLGGAQREGFNLYSSGVFFQY